MYSPSAAGAPPVAPAGEVPGPARYGYLVSRLRQRQITMEEATELFGILQAMLRESQAARARLEKAQAPPPTKPSTVPAAPVAVTGRAPMSDDFLLLGLLALGAGTGLGAAFAKRLSGQDGASPGGPGKASSEPARRASRPS